MHCDYLIAGGNGTSVLIRAPLGFAASASLGLNDWACETVAQHADFAADAAERAAH